MTAATNTFALSLPSRRIARKLANASRNNLPVVVSEVGESWHCETMGGTRITCPAAYSKNGWSNMRYVPSSRRVDIGIDDAALLEIICALYGVAK